MIGDRQNQNVGSEGMAIQAGRDLIIQSSGLTVADVMDLCRSLLEDNFPKLREEANKTAQDNAERFAKTLEERLTSRTEEIVIEKLGEPDVQAAINDAVKASARRGESANTETLAELITERVSMSSDEYKDLVISEAITVVPKITKRQINHLSFVHYMVGIGTPNVQNLGQLESLSQAVLVATNAAFSLSRSQRRHLEYAGTCSIAEIMEVDIYNGWMKQRLNRLGYTDADIFKRDISVQSPTSKNLLDAFDTHCKKGEMSLTSVGQAIAIANLSTTLGKLDYSNWLN